MKQSQYNSYDDLPLFLNAEAGAPGKTQHSGFAGERRSSGMSEFSPILGGNEGYGTGDDEAKVLGVSSSTSYELMHVVVTSSVSLAPPQAAELAHFVVPPLPTQTLCVCAGTPFAFPVLNVGSRMVVRKEAFIQWVTKHTEGGVRE